MSTTTAQLCQCGAPAALGAYLCDHCTGRLRIELRRLAPGSDRPGLTRWDTHPGSAGLGDDLDTQAARQARIGDTDTRGGEKPIPFHERAAQVRATLLQHLHPWATWVAGQLPPLHGDQASRDRIARWHFNDAGLVGPERPVPTAAYSREVAHLEHQLTTNRDTRLRAALDRATVGELAQFLLDQVERIRLTDGAAALAAAVFDAVRTAERTIDLPPELQLLGECGHELPDGILCPVPLYAEVDASFDDESGTWTYLPADPDLVIACTDRAGLTGCGTEWKVAERRAWLQHLAVDELATAATIATALSRLGREVKAGRLRQWRNRNWLTDRASACPQHRAPLWVETGRHTDCPACGPALYRVGDVMRLLELADAAAQDRASKRAARISA